jgi:hypothetical protein
MLGGITHQKGDPMSKKPHRVLWQVLPHKGLFRWKVVRDSLFERFYLTQAKAIKEAKKSQEFEWECYKFPSELQIHGRDGQIREKDTYPRESDPIESKG